MKKNIILDKKHFLGWIEFGPAVSQVQDERFSIQMCTKCETDSTTTDYQKTIPVKHM